MMKRTLFLLSTLLITACSGTPSAPPPCADDSFCPTGSYCDRAGGKCSPIPSGFEVTLAPATPITAGKTVKLSTTSLGGVTWSVQEADGGTIDADGTYHAPATPGTYHVIATSTADPSKKATVAMTVAPVPLAPVLQAAAVVTAGAGGLAASVTGPQDGMTFAWTIQGGALPGATTGPAVSYSAGTGASLTLTCTATNVAGDSAQNSRVVAVAPVPPVPVITAKSPVTVGKGGLIASISAPSAAMTYAWTITGGSFTTPATGTSVTWSVDALATQVLLSATSTNAAGAKSAAGTLTIPTVTLADTTVTLAPYVTRGKPGLQASAPVQAGCTYAWSINAGLITAGDTNDTVTFTAPADSSASVTLTVTITNAAGDPATGFNTSTVVDSVLPVNFQVPATVTTNQGGYAASISLPQPNVAYTWSATNATINTSTSGSSIQFTAGNIGPYTLKVTGVNLAGDAVDSSYLGSVGPVIVVTTSGGVVINTISPGVTYTATVPAAYLPYDWTQSSANVTILTGAGTNTITFKAAAVPAIPVRLEVTLTTPGGDKATGAKTLILVALDPAITVTTAGGAATNSISQGVTYTAKAGAG